MHYSAKHAAPRSASPAQKALGAAALGGATVAATLTAGASAQAAGGNVWDRVAQCESGGRWNINTGNGYYGGLQFASQTWRGHGGTRYASHAHRATRAQQIAIAKNVLRTQGPRAWPRCSIKAGLTKANGLAADGGSVGMPGKASRGKVNRLARASWTASQVRAVQQWAGTDRSGKWTRTTTRAVQRKIGAGADGVVGPQTVRLLERKVRAKQTGLNYLSKPTMKTVLAYVRSR